MVVRNPVARAGQLLLLVALLASALAGCLEAADDAPSGEADPEARIISDPTDYSYLEDNNTTGAHVHDYWGGLDRIPILDETQYVGITWNGGPSSFAEFLPPDDVTIPMGTATVEVTVAWEGDPNNNHDRPQLWVRTANDSSEQPVAIVDNGDTVEINVTNDDNDLPHQLLSAWEFHFYLKMPEDDSTIEFSGDVTFTVWAERGLPIPLFPAHPDQWQGRDEIPLFDDDRDVPVMWIGSSYGPMMCYGGCLDTHDPVDGAVVPLDADHVRITVTYDQTTATKVQFLYHASDSRAWAPLEEDVDDDAWVDTYIIPIVDLMGDGPYAKQSLWRLAVQGLGHGTVHDAAGVTVCSGCESAPFSGGFHVDATVHKMP